MASENVMLNHASWHMHWFSNHTDPLQCHAVTVQESLQEEHTPAQAITKFKSRRPAPAAAVS